LTLVIRNAASLENGSPLSLVLDRRGAIVGRAATCDWCLPDPSRQISSRHCEIRFSGGGYELVDTSTNGTFLQGQDARLGEPRPIAHGDVFLIGSFEIAAALDGASLPTQTAVDSAPNAPEWKGWSGLAGDDAAPPVSNPSSWDATPTGSAISGTGPMSQNWAPPSAGPAEPSGWSTPSPPPSDPEPIASAWVAASPPPASTPASEWSSPTAPPAPPSGDDIWGKFAQSNVVDWARGGFGSPAPAPPPLAGTSNSLSFSQPSSAPAKFGSPAAMPADPALPSPPPTAAPVSSVPAPTGGSIAGLLAAAGMDVSKLKQSEAETLAQAGNLLRRLVSGLVVMLEARARAKSQMGAQGTNLEFDGNNPLKFSRSPEQALAQLLNPPERGFMTSDRAIEDAYKDLQAHQMATLKAMQGALRATLDRFSPNAIRARAQGKGMLAKILPAARDAALWNAYEKEFSGVAHGSDEAFMDMFAKEFRRAYEEIANQR
jgi:type VI secretion system protein